MKQIIESDDYGRSACSCSPAATRSAPAPSNNPEGSSYVRVCDAEGAEVGNWVADEWAEGPQLVMGAIIGAAARS